MKKRILAMLLSVILLATSVGITTLFTGGNGLFGNDTPYTDGPNVSSTELNAELSTTKTDKKVNTDDSSVLDENNALRLPYDQAFPEEFDGDDCLYARDRILVKFATGFSGHLSRAMKKAGMTGLEKLMDTAAGPWYIVSVSGDVKEVMAKVRDLKNVKLAEYDFLYSTADTIVDSDTVAEAVEGNVSWRDQWHLRSGNLQKGWDLLRTRNICPGGDSSVTVAVIDTGVDYTHEDLQANIWTNTNEIPGNGIDDDANGYVDDVYGVDLVSENGGSGMDDQGHGTHVAGIIAAANNNIGIVGLAYNVKIMPIKAGMASGYFHQSDVAKAILYAYENGADVINMSFGGTASTIAVQDALELAFTRCVLVAAAGNGGAPNEGAIGQPNYPAALSYVMGVMSVDQFGIESSFTNYDSKAFNSVEYEVYAPGSQILSTIPGNRYATWSGTSMATPYVSALAALLRSAYPDPSTYTTRFIYGQIAATGDRNAICCDPKVHRGHNLPQIVDVYNALTKTPKPEVSAADVLIFDDPSYSDKNNGDGIIDAGETVALAFTLRNRWGAAYDTTVTLDAKSQAGIDDPYIQFIRSSLNYGTVGTYANRDCGLIREGNVITGAAKEDSLLVKIADDCPNDYIANINIHVTCKNDLDKNDTALYTGKTATAILTVRRGTLLPSIIKEDTTLTKDNYYILPNSTLIPEGVTVTVEPGTQIQFWSADPNDAYADTAITFLRVNGTLLCRGTEDEHIRMFPSELMDRYRVELQKGDTGVTELYYTDVVNPYLTVSYAENCEFSQNYRNERLDYRYLSGGKVESLSANGGIKAELIRNCAFYKLGAYQFSPYRFDVASNCENCIFVDSAVELNKEDYLNYSYTDCVFYGNNNYLGEDRQGYGVNSNYRVLNTISSNLGIHQIIQNPDTGTYYVSMKCGSVYATELPGTVARRLAQSLGGDLACMETEEETAFLRKKLEHSYGLYDYQLYLCDPVDGKVPLFYGMGTGRFYNAQPYVDCMDANGETSRYYPTAYVLLELPDASITDIILENEAHIDTGMTYQLRPSVEPMASLLTEKLVYASLAPDILSVDENGLVTPLRPGSGVIRVSNEDGSVYRDMAVYVTREIPLTGLSLPEKTMKLDVGTSAKLEPTVYPANTTRTGLLYTSSDPNVVTVDGNGVLTAVKAGMATVTVTPTMGEDFSTSVTVTVVKPATSISFKETVYVTSLDQAEDDLGLTITPLDATERDITWTSSNPEVCTVGARGKLLKYKEGTATLRASLNGTELYAEITVSITSVDQSTFVEEIQSRQVARDSNAIGWMTYYYARLSDGTLWQWGGDIKVPQKLPFTGVSGFAAYRYDKFFLLDTAGVLRLQNIDGVTDTEFNGTGTMTGVKAIFTDWGSTGAFYALREDGSVWAWGNNSGGKLGYGSLVYPNCQQPVQMILPTGRRVVDIQAHNSAVIVLLDNGDVYGAGNGFGNTPIKVMTGVSRLVHGYISRGNVLFAMVRGDTVYVMEKISGSQSIYEYPLQGESQAYGGKNGCFYIKNGIVFARGGNNYGELGMGDNDSRSEFEPMLKITEATQVFPCYDTTFIQTKHGFYGVGENNNGQLADGTTTNRNVPVRIAFGITANEDAFALTGTNLAGTVSAAHVLKDKALTLDFNEALVMGENYGLTSLRSSAGMSVSMFREICLDKLTFTPAVPLIKGQSYTLTIPAGALQTKQGVGNEEITLTFTANQPVAPEPAQNTAISFASPLYIVELTGTDSAPMPVITPTSQDLNISWTSSNPAVCYVDAEGNLIKRGTGCAMLRAAIDGTDLYAETLVYISDATEQLAVSDLGITADTNINLCNTLAALPSLSGVTDVFTYEGITCFRAGETMYTSDSSIMEQLTNAPAGTTVSVCKTLSGDALAAFSNNILLRDAECLLLSNSLTVTMNHALRAVNSGSIRLTTADGTTVACQVSFDMDKLTVTADKLTVGDRYTLTVPAGALADWFGGTNEEIALTFTACNSLADGASSLLGADRSVTVLESGAVSDDEAAAQHIWTKERFDAQWEKFCDKGYNTTFFGNAILNRFTDTNVEKWLRITAPESSSYTRIGLGGNYWGTEGLSDKTKAEMINKMIVDFDDYQNLADLNEGTILESIPETVWPSVRTVELLNEAGEPVSIMDGGKITVRVTFNRDMDTDIPLQVRHGSSYPYADYEVAGQWVDARTWSGTLASISVIANGNQYWSINNGRSAQGHLKLYKDWGRFTFKVDTTIALAMNMQAEAKDDGVNLTWNQDDFETLAGYNVYRSEYEDGQYVRLNTSVIPADVKEFFDTNVTPGKLYYYNFTVVKTDLSESEPSGKVSVRAKDTMAPSIIHDGVYNAFAGDKLVINASVTDNLQITGVELFYRVAGTSVWKSLTMTAVNDKYSAIIPAFDVTTEGLEYYIRAFDGVNYSYKGSAEKPFAVSVQETVDSRSMGDVNLDGQIDVLDALMVLQAINDRLNLTAEQFARADLNGNGQLEAVEVLTILQYANGTIGSVKL